MENSMSDITSAYLPNETEGDALYRLGWAIDRLMQKPVSDDLYNHILWVRSYARNFLDSMPKTIFDDSERWDKTEDGWWPDYDEYPLLLLYIVGGARTINDPNTPYCVFIDALSDTKRNIEDALEYQEVYIDRSQLT